MVGIVHVAVSAVLASPLADRVVAIDVVFRLVEAVEIIVQIGQVALADMVVGHARHQGMPAMAATGKRALMAVGLPIEAMAKFVGNDAPAAVVVADKVKGIDPGDATTPEPAPHGGDPQVEVGALHQAVVVVVIIGCRKDAVRHIAVAAIAEHFVAVHRLEVVPDVFELLGRDHVGQVGGDDQPFASVEGIDGAPGAAGVGGEAHVPAWLEACQLLGKRIRVGAEPVLELGGQIDAVVEQVVEIKHTIAAGAVEASLLAKGAQWQCDLGIGGQAIELAQDQPLVDTVQA